MSAAPLASESDLPAAWANSPVGDLVRIHNLGHPATRPDAPRLIVATCMDSRIQLRIPPNFAFLLRAAGADLRAAEFDIAVAVATRGVRALAVVTHTDCAMSRATAARDALVEGLADVGWSRADAENLFERHAREREIGDEAAFAAVEAERIRARYPTMTVVPLLYKVEDGLLYAVS